MASARTCIDPAQGHRLWAESYDTDLNPLLALEQRVLRPHLDRLQGELVVDIGCGTGRGLMLLREAGARYLGFDLTAEMLAKAAAKPGLAGKLARADALRLPLASEASDLTLCSFCVSYMRDLEAVFRELGRITRPGGRIIVSDLHPAAVSAGWKRTFRSSSRTYEIETCAEHQRKPLRAGLAAGLTLWRALEPRFGEAERALFEKAGKGAEFESVASTPALLITLWDRPS